MNYYLCEHNENDKFIVQGASHVKKTKITWEEAQVLMVLEEIPLHALISTGSLIPIENGVIDLTGIKFYGPVD